MNLNLNKKIVLITGGTGAIGGQICLDFLAEEAVVICLYRNETKLTELKNWLRDQKCTIENLHGISCDLLNQEQIKNAIKEIEQKFERVDVLVNCAGTVLEYPFAMMEERHIDDMLNQNMKATMLVTQAVLKPMFRQKSGAIVNISSVAGTKAGRGIVVYAAAKAGIDSFTRTLASEVGRKNIRVNCVRPGAIKTPMSSALEDRATNYVTDSVILGRFGKPEEVSKAVLFLSSDSVASYITGTTLNIDGGLMF